MWCPLFSYTIQFFSFFIEKCVHCKIRELTENYVIINVGGGNHVQTLMSCDKSHSVEHWKRFILTVRIVRLESTETRTTGT